MNQTKIIDASVKRLNPYIKPLTLLFKAQDQPSWGSDQYIAIDSVAKRVFIGRPGDMEEAELGYLSISNPSLDGATELYIGLLNGDKIYAEFTGSPQECVKATFKGAALIVLDPSDKELISSLNIVNVGPQSKGPAIR